MEVIPIVVAAATSKNENVAETNNPQNEAILQRRIKNMATNSKLYQNVLQELWNEFTANDAKNSHSFLLPSDAIEISKGVEISNDQADDLETSVYATLKLDSEWGKVAFLLCRLEEYKLSLVIETDDHTAWGRLEEQVGFLSTSRIFHLEFEKLDLSKFRVRLVVFAYPVLQDESFTTVYAKISDSLPIVENTKVQENGPVKSSFIATPLKISKTKPLNVVEYQSSLHEPESDTVDEKYRLPIKADLFEVDILSKTE